MDEPAVKQEAEPVAPTPEKAEAGAEVKTEPQPAMEDTTTTNPPPAPEPTQAQEPEHPVKTEKADETPATAEQSGEPSTETKLDTGLSDTGINDFDLHLDFGDDDGNQNFLTGTNFGATTTTTTTTTGGGNESGPNPSNMAIPGGDAFDMEFQKVDAMGGSAPEEQQQQQQQQPQAPPAGETAGGDQSEEVMEPGESSFDDLFMGSADLGGETGEGLLEGDGLMNLNELDDNWFT